MKLRLPRLNARSIHTSDAPGVDISRLREELISRPPHIIRDFLSPTNSYLLQRTLAKFTLPPSVFSSREFRRSARNIHIKYGSRTLRLLAPGHHLVYFAAQVTDDALLPDGTDKIQWPGEPFVRRVWAGGSLQFNTSLPLSEKLFLDGSPATCREIIRDVTVKGKSPEVEKVCVHIERQISLSNQFSRPWLPEGATTEETGPAIVERRDIVFLRAKSPEAAKEDAAKTQRLLRGYAREVEGYRNVLVHGPLCLLLMLTILRTTLRAGQMVLSLDYKNWAPLYAEEELKVCVRKKDTLQDSIDGAISKYELWIEGPAGGIAVRGSATVKSREDSSKDTDINSGMTDMQEQETEDEDKD